MKKSNPGTIIAVVGTGVLFFLLGIITPMQAQREQHKQDAKQPNLEQEQERQQQTRPEKQQPLNKPAKQEHQLQQQVRPEKQEHLAKPERQEHQQAGPEKQEQQAKPLKQEQQHPQQVNRPSQQVQIVQRGEQRGVWRQHRASNWQTEHHTWQERGGYNGYRIPDNHFHGYFGRDHGFRIYNLSLEIFGGHPRFMYNGYWISFIDPWPEYWSVDWYENDDVYIDYYGDGYYLYNRRHPRDRIAVTVFIN